MISLDSASKADHFMKQVAADGESYFWAGGRLSSNKASLTWENGKTERISRGRHPWSFAGLRGPQPDGQGTEHCLAILNNIYKVSWSEDFLKTNIGIVTILLGWCQVP